MSRNNAVTGMKNVENSSLIDKEKKCFVCDAKIQGKSYKLASCRTQRSKARVLEKLGSLVGDRYMVVIAEDDQICRSCANLMNTLDRLESEMKCIRRIILRFLEQKYSLAKGELSQAVQENPSEASKCLDKAQVAEKRPASEESCSIERKICKPTTLQCDKCQYSTTYHAYMVHHLRQHINTEKQPNSSQNELSNVQNTHDYCQPAVNEPETSETPELKQEQPQPQQQQLFTIQVGTPPTKCDVSIPEPSMMVEVEQSTKQIMTVSEDGTLELIAWNGDQQYSFNPAT